uniref:NADH dehydrogenase subunit 2 n=1 Tax=Hetaerina titia TaxID=62019 RepID=UPI002E791BC2|nr:NADH dehydrogenase subunit 2 [Hetaerina titia]WPM98323.1 NADH dehydrogenase subunit 2 [Hetaerina titia]
MNLSFMLFTLTLITGTVISISANSWMLMWMGLELNLMSFIPMMNKNNTPYESESSMKYFLVQALASIILLVSILMSNFFEESTHVTDLLLFCAVLMKMGASPFHLWLPGVMQGITWMNCFIIMTWQKIAPMVILGYQLINNKLIIITVILSTLVGSIGGLSQTSVRKMMAYSSISHIGWMIMALMMSNVYWALYFMIYTVLNMVMLSTFQNMKIYHLTQMFSNQMKSTVKFTLFINMMSLGGLPPFLGFFPKWMIIQNMINQGAYLIMFIMIMTTMVTLYMYLRIMYSAFLLQNQKLNWKVYDNQMMPLLMLTSVMSLMGLPMISIMNL